MPWSRARGEMGWGHCVRIDGELVLWCISQTARWEPISFQTPPFDNAVAGRGDERGGDPPFRTSRRSRPGRGLKDYRSCDGRAARKYPATARPSSIASSETRARGGDETLSRVGALSLSPSSSSNAERGKWPHVCPPCLIIKPAQYPHS